MSYESSVRNDDPPVAPARERATMSRVVCGGPRPPDVKRDNFFPRPTQPMPPSGARISPTEDLALAPAKVTADSVPVTALTTYGSGRSGFRALHEGDAVRDPEPLGPRARRGCSRRSGSRRWRRPAPASRSRSAALDGGATLDEVVDARPRARRGATGAAAVGRPRERLRARPEDAARDRAGRDGGGRGRFDRGLRPGRRIYELDAGGRAGRGRGRGGARPGLPVHAHRARREPHPRQPGSRRHDCAAAALRTGGRRRPCTPRACARVEEIRAVCAAVVEAAERARPSGLDGDGDRGRRAGGG